MEERIFYMRPNLLILKTFVKVNSQMCMMKPSTAPIPWHHQQVVQARHAKSVVKAWETIKKIPSLFDFCGSRSLGICDYFRSMETLSYLCKTPSVIKKLSLPFSNQSNTLLKNLSALVSRMREKSQVPTTFLIESTVFIILLISLQWTSPKASQQSWDQQKPQPHWWISSIQVWHLRQATNWRWNAPTQQNTTSKHQVINHHIQVQKQ